MRDVLFHNFVMNVDLLVFEQTFLPSYRLEQAEEPCTTVKEQLLSHS